MRTIILLLLLSQSLYAQTNISTIKFNNFTVFLLEVGFIHKDGLIEPSAVSSSNESRKAIKQKNKKTVKKKIISSKAVSEDEQLYQSAKKLLSGNSLKESENIFIDLMQKYPDSKYKYSATYHLGEIMHRTGRPDESLMYYNKIIHDFPGSKYADDAYFSAASIYLDKEEYSDGLKYLSIMQEKFKSSSLIGESYILKGEIYEELKNYAQAIDAYINVVDNYNNSSSVIKAYFRLGSIYKTAPKHVRNFEKSSEYFQKIVDHYPKSRYASRAERELKFIKENFFDYK